ncbi:response regulator [Sulfitobacter aestuariivivens]|uniref:Response regulator n=1 Tax=Sulfitobacter aestuariivivens TaxID=2766981 RepID=A0A927D0H6_9RHOB|nr:response regulator [Sulfitobacter aestuariivivens]MBD3662805.1 response regulator [Sulfitobacter aestuariivivens]
MPLKPIDTVLLVDDSEIDNRLHARAIDRTGLARQVLCFPMAEDAIAHMRKPGAIPADLILLDINMPRMNGFEMLDASVAEFGEAFMPSVVVMLTTSLNPRDQSRAKSFSVIHDYFQKPLTAEKFTDLVSKLNQSELA